MAAAILLLVSCGRNKGYAPSAGTSSAGTCPSFLNGNFALPALSNNSLGVTGDITDWIVGGTSFLTGVANGNRCFPSLPAGTQCAVFEDSGSEHTSTLSQTLTGLTVGKSYSITFAISSINGTSTFSLSAGGVSISSGTAPSSYLSVTSSPFTASATTASVLFTIDIVSNFENGSITGVTLNCL